MVEQNCQSDWLAEALLSNWDTLLKKRYVQYSLMKPLLMIEQEDFIIVQRALEKEHIDEIISISKKMRESKYLANLSA